MKKFSAVNYLKKQSKWHTQFGKLAGELLKNWAIKNDGTPIKTLFQSNQPRYYCNGRQISEEWTIQESEWVPYAE